MDQDWRKQLKAKGAYMVMLIMGSCLSVFLVAVGSSGVPEGLILLPATLFCVIFGIIKIASVRKHNQRIKEKYLQSGVNVKVVGEAPMTTAQCSAAEEIEKYHQLLQNGAITQEEFDAKKEQLLNLR